jgi:hypothetical protein
VLPLRIISVRFNNRRRLEKCEKIMVMMMMMILLKEEEEKKPPCFSPLYRQNGENASRAD